VQGQRRAGTLDPTHVGGVRGCRGGGGWRGVTRVATSGGRRSSSGPVDGLGGPVNGLSGLVDGLFLFLFD